MQVVPNVMSRIERMFPDLKAEFWAILRALGEKCQAPSTSIPPWQV